MKQKKSVIITAVILCLLIAGAFCARHFLAPAASAGAKSLTVTVTHLSGDTKTISVRTDAEFLRGALEPDGIISGSESTYGLWIETVDGETADASLEQWWGYTVNGETAMYGADEQPVADGDVIAFVLNEGY